MDPDSGPNKLQPQAFLKMDDIPRRQDEAITHVSSLLCSRRSHASLLLLHYNWVVFDFYDQWFTNE